MDGVAVVVKLAVHEFGSKKVASELRRLAARLERYGDLPGWKFPRSSWQSHGDSIAYPEPAVFSLPHSLLLWIGCPISSDTLRFSQNDCTEFRGDQMA
jgi:hypothetical protein